MKRIFFLMVALTVTACSFALAAGIPKTLNYQGMLTQSDGRTPVADGQYGLTFKLYASPSASDTLWSESHAAVPASNGLFNVILGSKHLLDLPFDGPYWLGISVGSGPELSPRIQLTAVAYAFRAIVADSAVSSGGYGDRNSLDAVDGLPKDAVYVDDEGNVGIGTTQPQDKLHIYSGSAGTAVRLECPAVPFIFVESDHSVSAGRLWRMPLDAGRLRFDVSSNGVDFSSYRNVLDLRSNGDVNVNYKLSAGLMSTTVLTITGGSDIAEPFPAMDSENVIPGCAVVIDPKNPGHITLSSDPYDTRVAGIVSGAGGINTGLTLSQQGVTDKGQNVALAGRVYALATASNGSINPGDFLTTSAMPGHVMKATDKEKAQGAIIGKAMGSLEKDTGLILILVNLQ